MTLAASSIAILSACGGDKEAGISPQQFTDALHLVMDSDRAVYTKKVVGRLIKDE